MEKNRFQRTIHNCLIVKTFSLLLYVIDKLTMHRQYSEVNNLLFSSTSELELRTTVSTVFILFKHNYIHGITYFLKKLNRVRTYYYSKFILIISLFRKSSANMFVCNMYEADKYSATISLTLAI